MNYELLINDKTILSGDLIILALIILFILIVVFYFGKILLGKLRVYETLKYEFVTIIAHKFRTPLTQIKWVLETVLNTEVDPYKKESMENIKKSTETLIGLTNTLVDITDSANNVRASYNLERVNICEMVNKITNILKERFHEKNLFYGITCSSPEIFVKVDPARMDFVLQTIIENSINYSPPGRNVQIYISQENKKVEISVVDQGIGIDPSDISRIFTKFYRTKNAQEMDTEGFGVGLFLSKSVVKRHYGKLEVFSEGIGKGTTFTITLPAVE